MNALRLKLTVVTVGFALGALGACGDDSKPLTTTTGASAGGSSNPNAAGSSPGGGSTTPGTSGTSGTSGTPGNPGSTSGTSGTSGSSGSTSSGASSSSSVSGTSSSSSGPSLVVTPTSDVLQHHTNATRDGVYTDPTMTTAALSKLALDTTYKPTITGNVYAQPLYVGSGVNGKPTIIVATEENHVIALDPTTSTAPFWDATFGTPVKNVGSVLGCGNIDPLGITGTPIIDPTSHAIYFDAMTLTSGAPLHVVHAISMATGTDLSGWPVSLDLVPGFTSLSQNQRPALQLLNGVLYIAYGGHNGDCGTYSGWVVSVPVANPSQISGWTVPSVHPDGGAFKGGIWGVGGLPTDGTSLFVTTGNTQNAGSTWSGGEALLRLTPPKPTFTATAANAFYPSSWMNYDTNDSDIGSANPVVFDMPGAPVPHLVVALGKDGILYLLNRDNLGGEGNPLSTTTVATDTGQAAYWGSLSGAAAVYTTSKGTYVAFHGNANAPNLQLVGCPANQTGGNLGVAQISATNPPKATVVWCATQNNLGSPMVTTSGAGDVFVWDASTGLYAWDGDTGAVVFNGSGSPIPAMQYFNTPIDAAGTMVVATSGGVSLFRQ